MWPWPLSVPYKYLRFWLQLVSLVLLVHVVVLAALLFIQHDAILPSSITISARFAQGELPVVFMPLYKHVPGALQQLQQTANQSQKSVNKFKNLAGRATSKSQVTHNKGPYRVQARKLQRPADSARAKTLVKAVTPARHSSVVASKKTKVLSKKLTSKTSTRNQPVVTNAKATKSPVAIKPAPAIATVAKNTVSEVKAVNVAAQSDQVVDAKSVITDAAKVANDSAAKPAASATVMVTPTATASTLDTPTSVNNPSAEPIATTIGSDNALELGRKDLELLELQAALRHSMTQSWRPPLGFKRALTVIVAVDINSAGTVEQLAVQQSSGAVAFDASVQQAVSTVSWPAAAWGRRHLLTFQQ